MATGDPFYYFSSEGAYNMAAQNQMVTGTATTTTYGALGGSLNGLYGAGAGLYGGNIANQFHTSVQYVTQPSALSEYVAQASKPAQAAKKKLKGILANLRAEIEDWHGDILDRCPA